MADITTLSFALRFTAKLRSGLAASRPADPSGVGDCYYAYDTGVISFADAEGDDWVSYDLSDISAATPPIFKGARTTNQATGALVLNTSTPTVITFDDAEDYDTNSFYDASLGDDKFVIPSPHAAYYRITAECLLEGADYVVGQDGGVQVDIITGSTVIARNFYQFPNDYEKKTQITLSGTWALANSSEVQLRITKSGSQTGDDLSITAWFTLEFVGTIPA